MPTTRIPYTLSKPKVTGYFEQANIYINKKESARNRDAILDAVSPLYRVFFKTPPVVRWASEGKLKEGA